MFCTFCECFSKTARAGGFTGLKQSGRLQADHKTARKMLKPHPMASAVSVTRGDQVARSDSKVVRWIKIVLFVGIGILLYYRVIIDLAVDWWTIPSQSQGLLIPP